MTTTTVRMVATLLVMVGVAGLIGVLPFLSIGGGETTPAVVPSANAGPASEAVPSDDEPSAPDDVDLAVDAQDVDETDLSDGDVCDLGGPCMAAVDACGAGL